MKPKGAAGFSDDLAQQTAAVGKRSPVQARLYELMRPLLDGDVGTRLAAAWQGREFTIFYERPLLLLGSLRFDALTEGTSHPLYAGLRDQDPDPSAISEAALRDALAPERPVWRSLARRFVQTNETSRAVVWRWPAELAGPRPLGLVDVGASAGLNLVADALESPWTDESKNPLPVGAVDAHLRLGLDARPLDVADDDAARWLVACVWPGERDRLVRLSQAIEAARRTPPALETLLLRDAPRRIARVVDEHPEALVLVYQSIVRDYLSAEERRAYEGGLGALVAALGPSRLIWLELELGGAGFSPAFPCELTAHLGDETLLLGRCGYHPSTVIVDAAAVRRYREIMGRR